MSSASLLRDRRGPQRDSGGRDAPRQDPGAGAAYAIVWHEGPGGVITTEIVPEGGGTVDPATIGVSAPPAARFPGGAEPEAWAQRGSVIVCINVDQYKGCLTVDD